MGREPGAIDCRGGIGCSRHVRTGGPVAWHFLFFLHPVASYRHSFEHSIQVRVSLLLSFHGLCVGERLTRDSSVVRR